ncbi:MAG: hypothetical protein KC620_00945, partial [Myxococcales bacterium]|nr:hypothetical protein [Myxococcales bacterium]
LAAGQRAAEIEARRRAEAAHRGPPSMAQPSAEERFNPLATGSALPIVRPTRAARPAPAAPVQSRQSIDSYANRSAEFAGRSAEFENSGMWSESAIHRIQPSAPPKALPVIGLAAAAAGIILAVLGAKLGGLFVPCGLLWIAGGLTLLGDKRWSWLFALASYWVNAAFLVVYGLAGNPPEWLPGSVLMLFGIIAGGVGGALLHPMFMQRYRKDRPRF